LSSYWLYKFFGNSIYRSQNSDEFVSSFVITAIYCENQLEIVLFSFDS